VFDLDVDVKPEDLLLDFILARLRGET